MKVLLDTCVIIDFYADYPLINESIKMVMCSLKSVK